MARVEDWAYRLIFLAHVHPDEAVRTAAEACELKWNGFFSSLGQDTALYRAARRLQPADETDCQLLATLLRDFEDAGVGLPPAQRARAKRLNDRIAEMGQQFERNVRDANLRVPFRAAELQGVPEAVWKDARRDADGRLLLGLDDPTYGPVLQLAESAVARERMWRAKTGEGGARNLTLLAEITRLRRTMHGCSARPAGPRLQRSGLLRRAGALTCVAAGAPTSGWAGHRRRRDGRWVPQCADCRHPNPRRSPPCMPIPSRAVLWPTTLACGRVACSAAPG